MSLHATILSDTNAILSGKTVVTVTEIDRRGVPYMVVMGN